MDEKPKRKTTTSYEVKQRYNQKTYKNIVVKVRRDSDLMQKIERFQEENPLQLTALIIQLLTEHFE